MTSVALVAETGVDSATASPIRRLRRADAVEHLALVVLVVVWAVPLTRGAGGRDAHVLLVYSAVSAVAAVAMRVWRLPLKTLATAAAVAASPLLVCAWSPTGWWGADVAAGYVAAAVTFLVVLRYARTQVRRYAALGVVALAGLEQFTEAFLPWWGSGDSTSQMNGTFYWHNPYAAFLLPAALISAGFVLADVKPWRLVGWVAAPLAIAGIVFSTSRATLAAVAAGWIVVGALLVRSRRTMGRLLLLTAVVVAVVALLPGPPFFSHYHSPFAATTQRASTGQSLSQNGYYRTEFWRQAVDVASHRPAVGGGFHSLATAGALYTPVGWARSQLAHNGYLQPLTDGGVVLGIPFLLAVALVAATALRRILPSRVAPRDPVAAAAGVALLAALAHSAVDFDWSHPSVLIEAAILAACLVSRDGRDDARAIPRPVVAARAVAAFAVIAAAAVGVTALHAWEHSKTATNSTLPAATRLAAADASFGDFRPARSVLQTALARSSAVTDDQAAHALALTAAPASIDVHLALLRDAVSAQRGHSTAAMADAKRRLAALHGDPRPYVVDLATVYIAGGDAPGAAGLLERDLRRQIAEKIIAPSAGPELALYARAGTASAYACAVKGVSALLDGAHWSSAVPVPSMACSTPW